MFRKSLRKSQLEGVLAGDEEGAARASCGGAPLDAGDFAVMKDIADDLRRLSAEVEAQGVPLALFKDKLCPPLVEQWWRERRRTETQTGQWAWRVIKQHFLDWEAAASDEEGADEAGGDAEAPEVAEAAVEERRARVEAVLEAARTADEVTIIQVEFNKPRQLSQTSLLELERLFEAKLADLRGEGAGRRQGLGGLRLLGCAARSSSAAVAGGGGSTLVAAAICAGRATVSAAGSIIFLLESAVEADVDGFSSRTFADLANGTNSLRALRAALRAFTPAVAAVAAATVAQRRTSVAFRKRGSRADAELSTEATPNDMEDRPCGTPAA